MASVSFQKENYFVMDDGHDGGGGSKLLHSQAPPGRKSYPSHHTGNAEVSNTALGLQPHELERTEKEKVA